MSIQNKKISVIIPTYNRASLLHHSLIALTKQTLDKDQFEVIVVDDGSSDHSEAVCTYFKNKLNITYFYQADKGFRAGKARNIGAAISEGEFLVFIDTSVILASNALEKHIEVHQAATAPRTIIGYVYAFGLRGEDVENFMPMMSSKSADSSLAYLKANSALDQREPQYEKVGSDLSKWPAAFDIFWTCHVSVERKMFMNVGGFDESFVAWGGEDVDLGIRLFKAGTEFYMNRDVCSFHWPHPEEGEEDKNQEGINIAQTLHDKYQLEETSYYGKVYDNPNMSLNEVLFNLSNENKLAAAG
jgi:GT2 family glycosyltransferase